MAELTFRFAEEKDCGLILYFIKELASYEKMLDEVVATEEILREWIFEKKKAEVIFACEDGKEIGFALFFHNFSTFLGRAGIYLEDLYVAPEYRGKGYGKALLKKLAQIAVERGCGRLEWWFGPALIFICPLAPRLWMSGRYIELQETLCRSWEERNRKNKGGEVWRCIWMFLMGKKRKRRLWGRNGIRG